MKYVQNGVQIALRSHVVPAMSLSVDDVRGYFTAQLNKRLQIGNVNVVGGTIAAEAVIVDNSLVQSMKIDRSTGSIDNEK